MRELRQRRKALGNQGMLVILPQRYKQRFDMLRSQLNTSVTETVCYLIDLATDDEDDENT
jgi:hypothetical protein